MTPLTNKYKPISILLILCLVSTPIFISHYVSKSGTNRLFQRAIHRKTNTDFTEYSKVYKDKVVLEKDDGVIVNNCRLVFKGIEDKMIHLNLYLLELDPEVAYPQKLSKKAALEGVRMGDSEFRLISVNKKQLTLKINTLYKTY
jgi:hypothetical protein